MYTLVKNLIPNKLFLKIKYYKIFKKKLNLKNPTNFNEKINYLKIWDDTQIKTNLQDKLLVKEIVANLIGEEYIIKTIKILDISLPFEQQIGSFNNFVIKNNFESGIVFFFEENKLFDYKEVQKQILESYSNKFYMHGRELHYKRIPKKTFVEQLLTDHSNILDYKFYCFDGQPRFLHIDRERYSSHKRSFYDMDWNKIENFTLEYPYDKKMLEMPKNFEKMKEIAATLSKGFKFARVDLYNHLGKIYFGEITFHPESGFGKFSDESYNLLMGELIKHR